MKTKKEFEIGDDGWVREVGELRVSNEDDESKLKRGRGRPKKENRYKIYVKTRLSVEDKASLELLERKLGKSTSDVIRDLIRGAAIMIQED